MGAPPNGFHDAGLTGWPGAPGLHHGAGTPRSTRRWTVDLYSRKDTQRMVSCVASRDG